ncbi:MAG: serine acetyltransferase [Phycisphaeraceae bacterium]|nr:serine acetyltransferase [Phycisphaeraceae bacterium]
MEKASAQLVISNLVDRLVESYLADPGTHHLDSVFLPNRAKVIEAIELLRQIVFPGFFDDRRLSSAAVHDHAAGLLEEVRKLLYEQTRQALRYRQKVANGRGTSPQETENAGNPPSEPGADELGANPGAGGDTPLADARGSLSPLLPGAGLPGVPGGGVDQKAEHIVEAILTQLPEIRRMLALDVQAAFDGDPAATSTDEIIFCYPGLGVIFVHRVAHEFWKLQVPLLPRMMSEYAHMRTGVDIHPGAEIGESFFIDHASGVVIGETSRIGNRVKIYQGVTLGALSTKGGQAWRGRKRHPTIEDDVTIYPNATILGGDTVIGRGCVVNGGVFITQSIPPYYTVGIKHPELNLRAHRAPAPAPGSEDTGS